MKYSWVRYVISTARHHLPGNLAVLFGVIVACVSVTGALVVGDSLRFSLSRIVDQKLAWVKYAVISQGMFRAQLASELGGEVKPAIFLQASVQLRDDKDSLVSQTSGVQIFGVEDFFWPKGESFQDESVIVNEALARRLTLQSGGFLTLLLPKQSDIPRESFLGRKDDLVDYWKVRVGRVLLGSHFLHDFSLSGGTGQSATVFVKISALQARLGVEGRANVLLSPVEVDQKEFQKLLKLEDFGLRLTSPEDRARSLFLKLDRSKNGLLEKREYQGKIAQVVVNAMGLGEAASISQESLIAEYRKNRDYLGLESDRVIVGKQVARISSETAQSLGLRASPIQVYLANAISDGGNEIPYSVIAGVDDFLVQKLGISNVPGHSSKHPPLWMFPWTQSPLKLSTGAPVQVKYFAPESVGKPLEHVSEFSFAGFTPATDAILDPDLTPEFPGITDKVTLTAWDPPFPYDNKKIKPRDEQYWKDFKTIPKAFVPLEMAQKLWGTRFGNVSSVRFYSMDQQPVTARKKELESRLLSALNPATNGLVFKNLREKMLHSSQSGTDFSQLFLGFSFFLIASGLILVGLLFRLHLERRFSQIGLLLALGATPSQVKKLTLLELMLVAFLGALTGAMFAGPYATVLLNLLKTNWPDKALEKILIVHLQPGSLGMGALLAFVMAFLAVYRTTGKICSSSVLPLLKGETRESVLQAPSRKILFVAAGFCMIVLSLLMAFMPKGQDHEIRAILFFGSGGFALTGFLFFLVALLRRVRFFAIRVTGIRGFLCLGLRNVSRNRPRTLLTSGLLASAAFLLIAVEPFRKDPKTEVGIHSGTGGFSLMIKTNVPVLANVQDDSFGNILADGMARSLRGDPQKAAAFAKELVQLLSEAEVFAMRYLPGDDASCANLFAPEKPRIVGIPKRFTQRGGFVFSSTRGTQKNPWDLLPMDTDPMPVFGEKNTVEWMLHSGIGKDFFLMDGTGNRVTVRFAGLLQNSLFQSEILLSEDHFLDLYPNFEGYSMFLIQSPSEKTSRLAELLVLGLAEHGVDIQRTGDLLGNYGAVENAYLSMFQALGSIGLLLGTFGVGATLIRSVWERRGEIGLLKAIGFTQGRVRALFIVEYGILLGLGLGIGTLSALFSVLPMEQSSWDRWGTLLMIQLGMFFFGLVICVVSLWANRRESLLTSMREE